MLRVIAIVLIAAPLMASVADDETGVSLSVKPRLCIVDQNVQSCDMSFYVLWRSDKTGYYCVFNEEESEPLRCWTEQRTGELSDERNVLADFDYWINQGGDAPKLAVVTVEVLRLDNDDRRRRRRTRHVWDVL